MRKTINLLKERRITLSLRKNNETEKTKIIYNFQLNKNSESNENISDISKNFVCKDFNHYTVKWDE